METCMYECESGNGGNFGQKHFFMLKLDIY